MIRVKEPADRDKMLEALKLFNKVGGHFPRVWDSTWHPDDLQLAEKVGIHLPRPIDLVKQFGGVRGAEQLAAAPKFESKDPMILKLVAVRVSIGRYPFLVVGETVTWDLETQQLSDQTKLELESPLSYGEAFGSLRSAIELAEKELKK